jgi:hypothetical protein
MFVKKRKMVAVALLAVGTIGLGTTVLACRTLVAAEGRATDPGPERQRADLAPPLHLIDDVGRLPSEAARLYGYVTRPFWPGELGYREIPWLVDLNEGIKAARDENRPLLLWTSGDEPLDRC